MSLLIALIYALPGIFLGCSVLAYKRRKLAGKITIAIWIATLSYGWWFLPLLNENLVGADHSKTRFSIMSGNAIVLLLTAIFAFANRSSRLVSLGISCIMLAVLWGGACFLTTVRL
ncbi:hypothetical protein [Edaphobacter bradus]|uniref:hypothetical protein n=1 Tax=Edaphobacter bradus TaxID=2259016 RepID=UPI0021E06BF0|nr:hypothetical protein [Edaphobacter bradus]